LLLFFQVFAPAVIFLEFALSFKVLAEKSILAVKVLGAPFIAVLVIVLLLELLPVVSSLTFLIVASLFIKYTQNNIAKGVLATFIIFLSPLFTYAVLGCLGLVLLMLVRQFRS